MNGGRQPDGLAARRMVMAAASVSIAALAITGCGSSDDSRTLYTVTGAPTGTPDSSSTTQAPSTPVPTASSTPTGGTGPTGTATQPPTSTPPGSAESTGSAAPTAGSSANSPADGWADRVYWARQRFDLHLSKPLAVPRCSGQWALIVSNETNPGTRSANIQRLLTKYPQAEYVRGGAAGSCNSLRAQDDSGNEVYAVIVELPDTSAICAARSRYPEASYAKPLDNGSSDVSRAFYPSRC